MKRLIISISLLIIIVAICLSNLWYLSYCTNSMVQSLTLSQQALSQGETARSVALLRETYQRFTDADFVLSITINEKQLDEVSLNFARTLQGAAPDSISQYAMELAALKESVIDLKRTELPTLGNLL